MEEVRAHSPHRQRAKPSPAPAAAEIASLTSAVRSGRKTCPISSTTPNAETDQDGAGNDCRHERAASSAPRGTKTSACPITSARSARLRLSKYDQKGTTISGRQNGGSGQVNRRRVPGRQDDGQAPDQERRHDPAASIPGRQSAPPASRRRPSRRPPARPRSCRRHDQGSRPAIASMARLKTAGQRDGPADRPDAVTARFPRRQGEQTAGQHPGEQLGAPTTRPSPPARALPTTVQMESAAPS